MFEIEIEYIVNEDAKAIAKDIALNIESDMKGPSSKSGKYHPPDEHCDEGLIMHCRRVAWWSVELCREHNFGDDTRDAMIIASMIHDLSRNHNIWFKHGLESWKMVSKMIDIKKHADSDNSSLKLILSKVKKYSATHMHHWDKTAPKPKSIDDYIFATADYCAALRNIQTPFLKPKK